MKSGENWSTFSEKTFKDYEIFIHVHLYIANGQGQILSGDKILIVTKMICYFLILTKRSCYFDHTL